MATWRLKRLLCAGVSAAVAVVVSSPLYADGSDGPRSGIVAPNQSVSIAEQGAALVGTDQAGPRSDATGSPETAVTDAHERELPRGPIRSSVLRRRDQEDALGRMQAAPAPWYRTGIGALAIVLALVGGVFWALRRWFPSIRVSDGGVIKVVARTAVSPKHNVALLRFGRRFILVGISGDRMSTLTEVTDSEEVADLVAGVGGASGFDQLLGREARAFGDGWCDDTSSEAAEESQASGRPGRVSFHANALASLKSRLRSLQTRQ